MINALKIVKSMCGCKSMYGSKDIREHLLLGYDPFNLNLIKIVRHYFRLKNSKAKKKKNSFRHK